MAKPYHAIAGLGFYRKVILGNGLPEEEETPEGVSSSSAYLPFKLTHRTP
ncbi:hypothetical protein [Laspinema olomoucense]|nr:hypothetical protein [Laspinema sp. D3d]MCT7970910.1 hypothetical protein [Laspinema sp. D3d]